MPTDEELQTVESADFDSEVIPLTERAVRPNSTIDLKLIAPGWGSSGYYSADVLRADGPTAWPAGTHMYLDHPTVSESKDRPERSVRDLAAVTVSQPEFREDGKAGPGLYAQASVLPQYRDIIDALAPHIGVSIRAHGSFKEGEADGRTGRVITRIAKGESVDFVTRPGAGGKVLALMESLRQNEASDVAISETDDNTAASEAAEADRLQEVQNMELTEAQERITSLEKDLEESKTTAQEATVRADRAEGALAILEAQGEARKLMENVSLPAAAKTRVITKVSADPAVVDGKLDMDALKEAVEVEARVEAEYIESIVGAGKVTDQGTKSTIPDEAVVKESLTAGLGRFFNLNDDAAKRAAEGR
jgi:hypothetical protein